MKQPRTNLSALKLVELLVRAKQALHRLDVLLLLEARKRIQIVDGLRQDLGLLKVLAVVAALGDQRVDNERCFGQRQRIDVGELAQLELCAGLLVAAGRGLGARSRRAAGALMLEGGGAAILLGHGDDGLEW